MSALFYKKQNTDEKHSDSYVISLVFDYLRDHDGSDISQIYSMICEEFPGENINRKRLTEVLEAHFCEIHKVFYLTDEQQLWRFKINSIQNVLIQLGDLSEQELYHNLYITLENYDFSVFNAASFLLAIEYKIGELTLNQCSNIFLNLQLHEQEYVPKIQYIQEHLSEKNNTVGAALVFHRTSVSRLVMAYGLMNLREIKEVSAKILLILMLSDLEFSIEELEQFQYPIKQVYINNLSHFFMKNLRERNLQVLNKRFGFDGQEASTLEECGEAYSLTRERVRQIEVHSIRTLKQHIMEVSPHIEKMCLSVMAYLGRPALSSEKLGQVIESSSLSRITVFLLSLVDMRIRYVKEIDTIYDSNNITEKDLTNRILRRFKFYIQPEEYEMAARIERNIIDQYYYRSRIFDKVILQKGYSYKDLIGEVITRYFPNGYRIYDQKDYEHFKESFEEMFHDSCTPPTQTAIRGMIAREDMFCQIARGTYKLRKYCIKLPTDLIQRIVAYIMEHLPVVEYLSIYTHFQAELNQVGVGSYFYMKGLIDPYLPDDVATKRSYITAVDGRLSAQEMRLKFIHSFDGSFTLEQMRKKFPGIKDYTFLFLFYDEIRNGLIWLSADTYIYFDKMHVDENLKKDLKEFIDQLFIDTDLKILTARKIYNRLVTKNVDLLTRMKVIHNQFALFSLLKYLYEGEYYFDRPYLSKDNDVNLTTIGVISQFLEKRDCFSYEDIKKYFQKMNIPLNMNYGTLMEDYSDTFVQINVSEMVRKEIFEENISEQQIKQVEQFAESLLRFHEEIHTENINDFSVLPQLKYPWNKYLFVGILRSYFVDNYEIQEVGTDYRVAEFVICHTISSTL